MTMFGAVAEQMPISDPSTAALLMAVRECLCEQAARTIYGPVCRCYVTWGANLPVQDGCACDCGDGHNGDAWVKLDALQPDLGSADQVSWCATGWVASITLGMYRCVPDTDPDTVMPADTITDTSLALLSDMAAMWRVLGCCDALKEGVRVQGWTPIDPTGGCAGGALAIQVPLGGTNGCPT